MHKSNKVVIVASKPQHIAVNASVNGMWQQGKNYFKKVIAFWVINAALACSSINIYRPYRAMNKRFPFPFVPENNPLKRWFGMPEI